MRCEFVDCSFLLLEHTIRCQCAWTMQTSSACGAAYDQNQCGHIVGVSSQAGKLATACAHQEKFIQNPLAAGACEKIGKTDTNIESGMDAEKFAKEEAVGRSSTTRTRSRLARSGCLFYQWFSYFPCLPNLFSVWFSSSSKITRPGLISASQVSCLVLPLLHSISTCLPVQTRLARKGTDLSPWPSWVPFWG